MYAPCKVSNVLKGIYIQRLGYLTTNLTDNFEVCKGIQRIYTHATEKLVVNADIQMGNPILIRQGCTGFE